MSHEHSHLCPRQRILVPGIPGHHACGGYHSILTFPTTFRAPRIRHLLLGNFASSRRFPNLLATTMNLVTLRLEFTVSFSFVGPNDLLQLLSLMPQLEIFRLDATMPDGEAAEQVWRRSNTM